MNAKQTSVRSFSPIGLLNSLKSLSQDSNCSPSYGCASALSDF